ncbi:MAG: hypothetical protein OXL96_07860 [Candidatus Poribacteria bacterium]|nr:hypothetical protein [Candidatus Poribacteria bacterium]
MFFRLIIIVCLIVSIGCENKRISDSEKSDIKEDSSNSPQSITEFVKKTDNSQIEEIDQHLPENASKNSVSLSVSEIRYNRLTFAAQFRSLTPSEIKWCTRFLVESDYSDTEYSELLDKFQKRKSELLKEWINTGGW